MEILRLNKVSKVYQVKGQKPLKALDGISISFKTPGFVSLIGKSGSGKSTLAHILANISAPTSGEVFFKDKNITNLKEKEMNQYRNSHIGIVFQHYHLIEHLTILENVCIPLLIKGIDKKTSEQKAKVLLTGVGINESMFNNSCKDLSGGEKQRVALCRAFINDPEIIIADEPTGALDSSSAKVVMDVLKKASKTKLVILISHNQKLVDLYSDRIIQIKDGKLIGDKKIKSDSKKEPFYPAIDKNKYHSEKWLMSFAKNNIKRRFKRNLFSMFAFLFSLTSLSLMMGFVNGSQTSVIDESYIRADMGTIDISKKTVSKIPGSKMSLTRISRLSEEDMNYLFGNDDGFYYDFSFDVLVPQTSKISYQENVLSEFLYSPIHSFSTTDFRLLKGNVPRIDSLREVLINKVAETYLLEHLKKEKVIGLRLNVETSFSYDYPTGDVASPYITETFVYEKEFVIKGVVDEFFFLTSPKVFYPYLSLKKEIISKKMIYLSRYLNRDVNWYYLVSNADGNSSITSFCHKLFLLYPSPSSLKNINNRFLNNDQIEITSGSLTIKEAFKSLIDVSSLGMGAFIIIAIVGSILLLGIVSYSSYIEDKKDVALLRALGCSKDKVVELYCFENLFVIVLSLVFSFALSLGLQLLINSITGSTIGIKGFIMIPFKSFKNIPFLFPILVTGLTIIMTFFTTSLPIYFSKKVNVFEELKEE